MKSLDQKLADIRNQPSSRTFILADAKDADMAFGVHAPGPRNHLSPRGPHRAQFSPEIWTREEFGHRNLPEFMDLIRDVVDQAKVDIMLMSASVNERLAIQEGIFRHSTVTPAARANDTSDVWVVRHGKYLDHPSQPFRSASIPHIQCGRQHCPSVAGEFPGANLGLYSITFLNDPVRDLAALQAFKEFRAEAEEKGFRYFLEVFDPNIASGIDPDKLGAFVNDSIVRSLAGVTDAGRPLFLKIAYHGPRFMEELAQYDPKLIVGILGGSAGTTHDAFQLIHDAQRYGARVALFGRKINNAEHQLAFIEMLRLITDGRASPKEAVQAYHAILGRLGIRPNRPLDQDLALTHQALNYGGRTRVISAGAASPAAPPPPPAKDKSPPPPADASAAVAGGSRAEQSRGVPDFAAMKPPERAAYHAERLRRRFG